jgi:hypothetical protein
MTAQQAREITAKYRRPLPKIDEIEIWIQEIAIVGGTAFYTHNLLSCEEISYFLNNGFNVSKSLTNENSHKISW